MGQGRGSGSIAIIGRPLATFAASLEKQFAILKEQLYKERMVQVDHKLQQIRGGRLQDYFVPLQQLQTNMDSRKEVAEVMKKYRVNNVKNKYEGELQACYQHFEVRLSDNEARPFPPINNALYPVQSEKNLAIDAISDELMEKVRRLEEDRHNVDISWADWGTSTRTAKVRGPGRKKAVTVSGPYIVYMLREEEILDDWTAIRKALKRSTAAAT